MNTIVRTLLAVFLIVISANAAAKEVWIVSGHVLEKNNNRPLSGVTVAVREPSTISATTDHEGRYKLTLPGMGLYTLFVTAPGFDTPAPFAIDVKEGEAQSGIDFYLRPVVTLSEVVVFSERSPDKISKTVLTREELRYAPGTMGDPLRALQSLPGVAMGSDTSSEPAIRGSGPRDNFYYADLLPIGQLFHQDGMSVFHASLINDFNLYSGAFGPQYEDVIGGVLDVSLRDPRTDKFGGIVGISFLSASVLLEGPVTDDQSFYFAARQSYYDLLVGKIKRGGVTIQLPRYYDYQAKYLWRINDYQRLSLYVNGTRDSAGLSVSESSDLALSQPVLAGDSNLNSAYSTQAVVWDSVFSGTAYNKLALGNADSSIEGNFGTAIVANVDTKTTFLRDQLNIEPAKNHDVMLSANIQTVTSGVNFEALRTTCSQFNQNCDLSTSPRVAVNESISSSQWDISARDRWLVLPSLTLIGGVRQSHGDYLNLTYTEPRLGMEWAYSGRTTLTAGWGKHNQLPAATQILRNYGNPNLSHILADQKVLGVLQTYDEGWSMKTEAYYKTISDFVVSDESLNYANGASGRAFGVELLLKKARIEQVSGWFALTLARSELRNDRNGDTFKFSFDQPVNATLVGNYKFDSSWMLGAKWAFHTGNPYTPIVGTNGVYSDGRPRPVYAAINSQRLPNYHRLDIRLDRSYTTQAGKLNIYFEVINVYNSENIAGYRYSPDYRRRTPVSQLPFLPNFGVELEF